MKRNSLANSSRELWPHRFPTVSTAKSSSWTTAQTMERPRVESFMASRPGVPILLLRHERNRGKGAAVRTAIQAATGYFSVIQDSDLEYDPAEFPRLLKPLLEGKADVVYGSRFLASSERRVLYYWHSLANHLLTLLCNITTDLNLTDMETCYKAFRTSLAKSIPIQSERFVWIPSSRSNSPDARLGFMKRPSATTAAHTKRGKKSV